MAALAQDLDGFGNHFDVAGGLLGVLALTLPDSTGSLTHFFNETHEMWWTMLLSGVVIEFTYYIGWSAFSVIAIIVVFACLYSGSLRRRYVREKQSKQKVD